MHTAARLRNNSVICLTKLLNYHFHQIRAFVPRNVEIIEIYCSDLVDATEEISHMVLRFSPCYGARIHCKLAKLHTT
jgi:hypothetical protein